MTCTPARTLFCVAGLLLALAAAAAANTHNPNRDHTAHFITNNTISGSTKGCRHQTQYFVNPNTKFPMCMGQTDHDLKNGMSIVNLIYSRGYLPTCRVMQLMLWMASEVEKGGNLPRDVFVDIGANIGKLCSARKPAVQCDCFAMPAL
jgi:hypothetical protein